jgi:hypothetical protein
MNKREELVAIIEELTQENYYISGDTLSNQNYENITFQKSNRYIVADIMDNGKGEIFAVKEIDGITYDASYQVMEILSIYDNNEIDNLAGGNFSEETFSVKRLSFNPKHWFLLKSTADWG